MALEFRFGGRKMNSNDWANTLMNEGLSKGKQEIERRVTAEHCPVHGQAATDIRWEGDDLKFKACCDAHLKAITVQVS